MPKGWRTASFRKEALDEFDKLHVELIGYFGHKMTLSEALMNAIRMARVGMKV